jgi:voltage-gated potassium channel Kch
VAFLLCGLRPVAEYRRILVALVPLSVVAIGVRFAEWFVPNALLPALGEMSTLLAMLVLAVAVGFTVFGSGQSVGERILGAVVLYLLIGIAFAVIYEIIAAHHPHAFSGVIVDHGVARWVYFGFVTLTTVGFGDIVAAAREARAMTILEALIGQLYPAIILARLVSLPTPTNALPKRQ